MDKSLQLLAISLLFVFSGGLSLPTDLQYVPSIPNLRLGDSDSCDSEFSCLNCTAVQLCTETYNHTYVKLAEFNCPNDTPFCDFNSGTCTANLPSDVCAPVDQNFVCSGDGYFPHPTDCQKYYSCIKGVAYSLECGNLYYDSRSETCQRPHPCYTIDCTDKIGVRVPYPGNYAYFAYCFNGSVLKFEKCPGNFELDPTTQKCAPICYVPGRQGDPFDCTKYYKCSYAQYNDTLTLYHYQCAEDELYDSLNSRCAPKAPGVSCLSGIVYVGEEETFLPKDFISKK